uniref:Putative ovule protein n=1 Tax=Solanum chacoense TaxID=4108 RepID=A0A0V0GQ41_SOLCH
MGKTQLFLQFNSIKCQKRGKERSARCTQILLIPTTTYGIKIQLEYKFKPKNNLKEWKRKRDLEHAFRT